MSDAENQPVDAPVAEAPAAETAPADADVDAAPTDSVKKVDKKSLLAKLKAIIKKVLPGKKEKPVPTTTEGQPEDTAAPVEPAPAAAPTTTAAA